MSSRQAIEAALAAADARLDGLAARMETYAADKLLDDGGKWTVRDCLCHVAASSNVGAAGQRALARLNPPATPAPAPSGPQLSVDERNQQAIEARASKSVADLIAEAKAGHMAALDVLKGMDDATLDKQVPDMAPGRPSQSVGGNILRSLEYHEGGQMDRIEAAINVRTRWA